MMISNVLSYCRRYEWWFVEHSSRHRRLCFSGQLKLINHSVTEKIIWYKKMYFPLSSGCWDCFSWTKWHSSCWQVEFWDQEVIGNELRSWYGSTSLWFRAKNYWWCESTNRGLQSGRSHNAPVFARRGARHCFRSSGVVKIKALYI